MQNKFKIGDRVRVVSDTSICNQDLVGRIGVVVGYTCSGAIFDVDLGVNTRGRQNAVFVGADYTGVSYWASELVLANHIDELLKKYYAS